LENKERRTILVVDDYVAITGVYEAILEDCFEGFVIKSFNRFAEAEEFINKNGDEIALALFDGALDNGRFGYELAQKIRLLIGRDIPIFLISGTAYKFNNYFDLFDEIMDKPVPYAELIEKIKEKLKS
jgi:Response regulators consisting of a CheY-like receiver domain and a winged-helix DNA-binding domain